MKKEFVINRKNGVMVEVIERTEDGKVTVLTPKGEKTYSKESFRKMFKKAPTETVEELPPVTAPAVVTATLKAFTGMFIGKFEAVRNENGEWAVKAKNGSTLLFNADGVQTNAKNPKFGNKLIFE